MARSRRTTIENTAARVGSRVARFCRSEASYAVLGGEGTWNAGGCTLLAMALRRLLGESAKIVEVFDGDSDVPHHSVVEYGGRLIDADGAQSRESLLRKMRVRERLTRPKLGAFRLADALRADHIYSTRQEKMLVKQLAPILRAQA